MFALEHANRLIHHTPSVEKKHENLRIYFNAILESENFFYNNLEKLHLSKVQVNMKLIEDLKQYLFGTEKSTSTRQENIINRFDESVTRELDEKGSSLWGLFNGVTYYTNHYKSHPKRENGLVESVMCGSGNAMNNKAFEFCMNQLN